MKLQVDAGQLRLRLSEAELARLLEQGEVTQALACPDGAPAHCRVGLREDIDGGHCTGNLMDLRVELPRAGFHAFAAERPRSAAVRCGCWWRSTCATATGRGARRRHLRKRT